MRKIFLSISFLLAATSASSAERVMPRPGLWEVTTKSLLLGMVPHVRPDQMQKLTSLAKQHGFDLPQIQSGAAISKVCITEQMAQQEIPVYFHEDRIGCTVKNTTRTESSYKMDLVCSNPQFEGSGTAEGTFASAESFSGQTAFTGTLRGNPFNDQADFSGRWIDAGCEVIKPLL